MILYEIVREEGRGVLKSPGAELYTGLVYYDKTAAEKEADRLWKENTTQEDRESGWCDIHFRVEPVEVK